MAETPQDTKPGTTDDGGPASAPSFTLGDDAPASGAPDSAPASTAPDSVTALVTAVTNPVPVPALTAGSSLPTVTITNPLGLKLVVSASDPARRTHLLSLMIQTFKTGSDEEVAIRIRDLLRGEMNIDPAYVEGMFYAYAPELGYWRHVPDSEIERMVHAFEGKAAVKGLTGKPKHFAANHSKAQGARKCLAADTEKENFFDTAKPGLAFENGFLEVSSSGATLHGHSSTHRARTAYGFDWDPTATAPQFLQMMADHFDGDADGLDKIECLLEFFGACLLGVATRFQKCLALPSDGGSGRSTLLDVVSGAFPDKSTSRVSAKELRDPERRSKIVGKLLNFADEVPVDSFLEAEDFKKCVAGNFVSCEEKYKPSYDVKLRAGHVFPIQLSTTAEISDAFWRRFIIVRYNRSFEGSPDRVLNLSEIILAAEVPGIVALLVGAASRLLARGTYLVPSSHRDEIDRWRMSADTVADFLEAACTPSTFEEPRSKGYDLTGKPDGSRVEPHDWEGAKEIYTRYREWCEGFGRKPVGFPEFKKRVEKLGFKLSEHTRRGKFFPLRSLEEAQQKENGKAVLGGFEPVVLRGALRRTP